MYQRDSPYNQMDIPCMVVEDEINDPMKIL